MGTIRDICSLCMAGPLLLVCLGCGNRPSETAAFDGIVTRELVSSTCKSPLPFTVKKQTDDSKRTYTFEFDLGAKDTELFYRCDVTVAPAGALCDWAKYAEAKKEMAKKLDDGVPDAKEWADFLFPSIGRRAWCGLGLGPGGGGDSVIFATSDGRFDVEVSIGNRLRVGLTEPGLETIKVAARISELYDKQAK